MKLSILVICLQLLFISHTTAQYKDAFAVQATIQDGIIEGNYSTRTGVQTYLGIPFAKPPVGELRWRTPQPPDKWTGVKETKVFGPRPMQKIIWDDMHSRSNGVSEDCLYLNVWTPAKRNTKGLPVLLYFYGGGNVAGDGSEPRYDGESMAQKGIVVVTANYRLNIFGFFAHPELSKESSYDASGNYGVLDQAAALKWVHDNIDAFGGDPDKITIAGESAGSIAVSMQMASPLSKDLIAGAIGESGAGIYPTMAPVTLQEGEKMGQEFLEKMGFSSFSEFRKLSSRDLYEIYNESGRFGFPVVIDNYFLPKSPTEIFNAKEQAQVPLLLGWNSAEIPGFAFTQGPYSQENYIGKVKQAFPDHFDEVLKLYPYASEEEIERSATDLASDRFIAFSTWKWFDLQRKNSDQSVFRYLYSKLRPPAVNPPRVQGPPMPPLIGAPHACEIEYCMGNLPLIKDWAWTEEDFNVSSQMQAYFANFIKTGDPNSPDLVQWPSAESKDTSPPVLIIDVDCKVIKAPHDSRYELLDKIYGKK